MFNLFKENTLMSQENHIMHAAFRTVISCGRYRLAQLLGRHGWFLFVVLLCVFSHLKNLQLYIYLQQYIFVQSFPPVTYSPSRPGFQWICLNLLVGKSKLLGN